ncbi:MAG: D-hexose-6-phosphate mutarotase [Propionibacteriaceae bacterium]|nr:D-hexose-6-phosphate mutarotase [Propionibacteriaceae bacterium]
MSYEVTSHPLTGIEARPGSGHYGVFDHGAHVWAWQPSGEKPVLWMSAKSMYEPGQAVRGGVPVIFPWFGAGPLGVLKPAHGFGRTNTWTRAGVDDSIDADGRLVVEYELDQTEIGPQADFPYAFLANVRVVFTPGYLQVELTVTNRDDVSFTFENALHTYIAVGEVARVSVEGLEGADYLDRAAGAPTLECVQDAPVTITAETDRLYMHTGAVVLDDPVWGRRLEISKEGSANTVVWNPWVAKSAAMPDFGDDEWGGMLCIEAVNALDEAITLAPGDTHVMRQRISLVAQGR